MKKKIKNSVLLIAGNSYFPSRAPLAIEFSDIVHALIELNIDVLVLSKDPHAKSLYNEKIFKPNIKIGRFNFLLLNKFLSLRNKFRIILI